MSSTISRRRAAPLSRNPRPVSRLLFFVLLLALIASTPSVILADGGTYLWDTNSGLWSTGTNWTVSGGSSPLPIPDNNATVEIIDDDTTSRTITYDYTGTPVTIGTLYIGNNNNNNGTSGDDPDTLSIAQGTLSATVENVGDASPLGGAGLFFDINGAIVQNGGTNNAGTLGLGLSDHATGQYELENGALNATTELIGGDGTSGFGEGTGIFTQTGGINTVGAMNIATGGGNVGNYNLDGGTLNATSILLEGAGNFNLSAAASISYGTFTQEGGTVTGNLTNNSIYDADFGQFNGVLTNHGTVNISNNILTPSASAGVDNFGSVNLIPSINGNGTAIGGFIGGPGFVTNESTGIIQGGGGNLDGGISVDSPINNMGLINANIPGQDLFVSTTTLNNTGTMESTASGILVISPGGWSYVSPHDVVTNSNGGMISANGGTTQLNFDTIINKNGTIEAINGTTNSPSIVDILSGTVSGGTISSDDANSAIVLHGSPELDGYSHNPLTLSGDIVFNGGVAIAGTIYSNTTISDAPDAVTGLAPTPLSITVGDGTGAAGSTSATLLGNGMVSMTQNGSIISGYSGHDILTTNIPIQGQGNIQGLNVINNSTISANIAGGTLYLRLDTVNNQNGVIQAVNGAAGNPSILDVYATTISGGTVSAGANSAVWLDGSSTELDGYSQGQLTLNGDIVPYTSFTIAGTIVNNSNITDATDPVTGLVPGALTVAVGDSSGRPNSNNATLSGSGSLNMTQAGGFIYGNSNNNTLTTYIPIQGQGTIYRLNVINYNAITANIPGATLQLSSDTVNNQNGIIQAVNGAAGNPSIIDIYGSTISGGTVRANANSAIVLDSYSELDGYSQGQLTLSGDVVPNTNFTIAGTIVNNANITDAPDPVTGLVPGALTIAVGDRTGRPGSNNATLAGTGSLNMTQAGAYLYGNTTNNTLNTYIPIRGQGTIDNLSLINNSQINANIAGATLQLANLTVNNHSGQILATNGIPDVPSILDIYASTISGGTVSASSNSAIVLDGNSELDGASKGQLTLSGDVVPNTPFTIAGTIVNNANITDAPDTVSGLAPGPLTIAVGDESGNPGSNNAILSGSGSLDFTYPGGSIFGNSTDNTLTNNITIAGQINVSSLNLINNGAINADTSPLTLDYGSALINSSTGTITAFAGEMIGFNAAGTLIQNGGSNQITSGQLILGELAGSNGIYQLSAGSLSAGNEIVGANGIGTFNQTGGTNTTTNLDIAEGVGSTGSSYTLSGTGSLQVAANLTVHPGGIFTQNPGTSLSFNTLTIAGGTLNGSITNASTFVYQSGTFAGSLINQGTANIQLTNGNLLNIRGGANNSYVALNPGSALNLAAATSGTGIGALFITPSSPSDTGLTIGGSSGLAPVMTFNLGAANSSDFIGVIGNVSVGNTGGVVDITGAPGVNNLSGGNYLLMQANGGLGGTGAGGFTLGNADDTLIANGASYSLSLADSTSTSEVLSIAPNLYWRDGNSNWSNGNNWSGISPTGPPASILPGQAANTFITDSDGTSRTVTYDYTGPPVTLALLTIDNTGTQGATNTLNMSQGGTLTANTINIGSHGLIQGYGTIQGTSLINNGTINGSANVPAQTLTLQNLNSVTNTGLFEVTNVANLDLKDLKIINAGGTIEGDDIQYFENGGVFTGAVIIDSSVINGGEISVGNSAMVAGGITGTGSELDGFPGAITFTADAQIYIATANPVSIAGNILGSGAISDGNTQSDQSPMNLKVGDASTPFAWVSIGIGMNQAASTISGFASTNTLTVAAGGGVAGVGTIQSLVLVNDGTIEADTGGSSRSLTLQNLSAVTNTGTFGAVNGANLNLSGLTINNTGGTVIAGYPPDPNSNDGSSGTVTLASSTVTGGTVTSVLGSGYVGTIQGQGTIQNCTLTNAGVINANVNGATLCLSNLLPGSTNTGTLEATGGGTLAICGSTISGGTITTDGPTSAVMLEGANTELSGSSHPLTIGAGGFVYVNSTSPVALVGTINNTGFITDLNTFFTVAAMNLQIGDATTSHATLSGGGFVLMTQHQSMISGYAGTSTLTNGAGQVIDGHGTIENLNLVNNGTICADPFLNSGMDLTLQNLNSITNGGGGVLEAANGNTLDLDGLQVSNSGGTVSAGASDDPLAPNGPTTGTVALDSSTITGGSVTSIAAGTLQGQGTLQNCLLTNAGVLDANVSGGTLTLSNLSSGSTNTGTLEATNGGRLNLTNLTITGSGTITADAVSRVVITNSNVTVGTLTVHGNFTVDPSTLEVGVLDLESDGSLALSAGDQLIIDSALTDNSLPGNFVTTGANLEFSGPGAHFLTTGNALSFADLTLDTGASLSAGATQGASETVSLNFDKISLPFSEETPAGIDSAFQGTSIPISYNPTDPANTYLLDEIYALPGGGSLMPGVIATSLTWNNASATGTGDGHTWDITNNTNWNNGAPAVYAEGANVIFNDNNNGNYKVVLNTTVNPGSVTVSAAGNYTISGTGGIAGAGSLTKSGSGMLTLSTANTFSGGTNVTAGTLVAGVTGAIPDGPVSITGGTLQLAANTGLATISSLSVTGSGTFDVNNNHVIINYGSPANDPIASIAALLAIGFHGGAWNGPGGIVSSAAAANSLSYGLGYADSADLGNPAGLVPGTIEIKYTLLGDANLSGVVDGVDFGIVAANFNKGVTGWDQGDFNYDNVVDGTDFGDLAANFNKGANGASFGPSALSDPALVAFAQANGLMADVPEPTSIGLAAIAGLGLLARRRSLSREGNRKTAIAAGARSAVNGTSR